MTDPRTTRSLRWMSLIPLGIGLAVVARPDLGIPILVASGLERIS
jgi:hypothetical protein